MKKVLFATTALIATASVAAADVRISGYGRFGLDYNDGHSMDKNSDNYNGVSDINLTSRLRLQFDMSAETDNGVAFGARFRAQAESRDNNPNGAMFNGARFFVTSGGFTLGVGNIIGAIENTPGLYLETRTAGTGIDGAGFVSVVTNVNANGNNGNKSGEYFNWDSYSSGGAGVNGVEALYTSGGFTGHISYSQDNDTLASSGNNDPDAGGYAAATVAADGGDRAAIMVAYTWNDWTAALSYQDSSAKWADKTVFTVAGSFGQFGVRFAAADNDGIGKYGLYGNMDIGAASNILLWVTSEDSVSDADVDNGRSDNRDYNGVDGSDGTSYGIHYSYDLGGGASFEAGARQSSDDNTTVQAGVYFSF